MRNLTTFLPVFQILSSRTVSETVRVSWPSGECTGLRVIGRDIQLLRYAHSNLFDHVTI